MNSAIFTPVRTFPLRPLAAAVLLIYAAGIQSAPVFQNSPGGNVTVSRPDTKTTLVTQQGSSAVANWRDFSIEADETVRFAQDNASAVILNRVTGENTSRILGTMQANGRVFLINPNGIVFGSNAQVNVNGLVASTLDLKSGSNSNSQTIGLELEDQAGSITNNGQITAKDILLIAPTIENNGTLKAEGSNSTVQLVAASEVIVNTANGNLVFQVEKGFENALIDQLGTLMAEGGRIILMASTTRGGTPSVINIANLNQATQISVQGDSVRLSGNINHAQENARLEVTAKDITQTTTVNSGGVVVLKADSVDLQIAENDFQGSVNLDINGQARLNDSNRLVIQGSAEDAVFTAGESIAVSALNVSNHLRIDTTDQVDLGPLQAGSLTVTTNLVRNANGGPDGAVNVSGATRLTAENVELGNASNDFAGTVNLDVSGETRLQDINQLRVAGSVHNAQLDATAIRLAGALNVNGNLNLQAESIQGDASLTVAGTTTIDQATQTNLTNTANDFVGTVILQETGDVVLVDRNSLNVQGEAGALTLSAPLDGAGLVTLGELTAERLVVNSQRVAQSAAVRVNGETILNAAQVELNRFENDFVGTVNLNQVGQANLLDANRLNVSGVANTLGIEAGTVLVDDLTTQRSLSIVADTIQQEGSLTASGETFLQGGSVNLATANTNRFTGAVELDLTGAAAIASSSGLQLSGKAATVNATAADVLAVSQLDSQTISLRAAQVELNGLVATGDLTLNGGEISQQGALIVEGITTLGASAIELLDSSNDFKGDVILSSAGQVALRDMNTIRIQGQSQTLQVVATAGIEQNGALGVDGVSRFEGSTIGLNNSLNRFGGELVVDAVLEATVHVANNLSIRGEAAVLNVNTGGNLQLDNTRAGSLNAVSDGQISQGFASSVIVEEAAALKAENVRLNSSNNDFKGAVSVSVEQTTDIRDLNNLQIQGNTRNLIANATNGTLTLGGSEVLVISEGALRASTIQLNRLNVLNQASLQANSITQTLASTTGGTLTLSAETVSLSDEGNDFRGEVVLNGVRAASVVDSNSLTIGGRASELNVQAKEGLTFSGLEADTLNAQAQQIDQRNLPGSVVRVNGPTRLTAGQVDLRNNNDFQSVVNLNVAGNARLRDANTLNLQGTAGELEAQAQNLEQGDRLLIAGTARLNANNTMFNHSGNDFQGEVILNATGNVALVDENTLSVSGVVNGSTQLNAQRVEQSGALHTGSSLLIQAENINLGHAGNALNGGVRIENAVDANLASAGNLSVTGSRLENLTLTADEVTLDALGALQTLGIVADEVNQTAALLVQGQTTLTAGHAVLSHSNNDFVGDVRILARNSSSPVVEISDANSLLVRGNDLQLGARVQGDLSVSADNLVFGRSVVLGDSQVDVAGNLTQSDSVSLNNAQLSANRIELNRSGNRFGGTTRIDSSEAVAIAASGDFNADIGTSSATLMLNISGNGNLQGEHARFAQSRFGENLTVNANQISQASLQALEVQGSTQLTAAGGSIALQNSSNRFNGLVSATAERTHITASQDLQLLNLSSQGGEISAGGRLLLLGNIEQLGGTLNFSAQGIPSPLSSAEISLLLPPALDIFSTKEAVNPITGLGRITLASPVIEQTGGQITTTAGSLTHFNSPQNGSIVLTRNNTMNGRVSALSGEHFGQAFEYLPNRGASLFAVNNDVKLQVGAQGVEADVIAIRAQGLATQGESSVIRARMPYNDIAAGVARSYAGLTLSIPSSASNRTSGSNAVFGESSTNGSSGRSGAIRVDVGDASRPGLGGFLTVLPVEGSNLLPGQVVHLVGPERKGAQAFFYDGARDLNRVPVVYNGSFLLSPQENAALTTAQGAVVLARQEQTRSVVRTENVAGKIINGVVLEVGPGRPATEGAGGAGKPASCEAAENELACKP